MEFLILRLVTLDGSIEMMQFVAVTWVTCRSRDKSHSLVNQSHPHAPSGTLWQVGYLSLREPCNTVATWYGLLFGFDWAKIKIRMTLDDHPVPRVLSWDPWTF